MENYDRTIELVETAQNSMGRSGQQFAKYQDTIEYKINQLKNSWEQFRTTLINSDVFKRVIEQLTKFVDKLNEIGPQKVLAIAAAIGAAGKIAISNLGTAIGNNFISSFAQALRGGAPQVQTVMGGIMQKVFNPGSSLYGSMRGGALKKVPKGEEEEVDSIVANRFDRMGTTVGTIFMTAFTASVTAAFTSNDPFEVIKTSLISVSGVFVSQIVPQFISGINTIGVAAATTEAFATLGISALIAAVAVLAGITVQYIRNIKTANEEWQDQAKQIKEVAENAQSYAKETKTAAEESKKTAENSEQIRDRYNELSQKVVLTAEEQEEYSKLVQEIRDNFPEVVSYYNEVTGELRVQNSLWESIIEKQKEQAKQDANIAAASAYTSIALSGESTRLDVISGAAQKTGLSEKFVSELFALSRGLDSTYNNLSQVSAANSISSKNGFNLDELANILGKEYYDESLGIEKSTLEALESLDSDLTSVLKDAEETYIKEAQNTYKQLGQIAAELSTEERTETVSEGEATIRAILGTRGAENLGETGTSWMLDQNEKRYSEMGFRIAQSIVLPLTAPVNLLSNTKSYLEGSKSVTQQLGGARFGVNSNNDFSNFSKLLTEGDKVITGAYADELIENLENVTELTVKNITDTWLEIYNNDLPAAQEAWDELAKDASGQTQILSQIMSHAKLEKIRKEIDDALTDTGDFFPQLTTSLEALADGISEEELKGIEKVIDSSQLDDDTKNYVKDAIITEKREELNQLQIKVADILGQVDDKWSTTTLEKIEEVYQNVEKKLKDEGLAKEFTQSLVDNLSDLDEKSMLTALQTFDWSKIDLTNIDDMKQQFIDTMQTAMGESFDQEKVESIWKNFFATAEDYNVINLAIRTTDQLDLVGESIETAISGYYEAFSGVSSYISEQVENGFIDPLSKSKIKEKIGDLGLNTEDYFGNDENGNIVFLYDKLYEDTNGLITNKEELIKKAKAEYEAGIQQLEEELAVYEAIVAQIQGTRDLTASTYKAAAAARVYRLEMSGQDYSEDAIKGLEKLAEAANGDATAFEEKIEVINKNITEMKENLNNEEYWENFIDARAYTNGLEKIETEAVKKGQEAAKKTNTTVDDTAKKITDAAEKVEKAQKKVIEAQEKLNEAMYGTEYHKNKLDPLYNYTNMLQEVQHQIDRTKDKIENFTTDNLGGSLEEYRKLLEQESSVYQAERKVYEQANANYQNQLTTGISKKIAELNKKQGTNLNTDIRKYYYTNPLTGMLDINFSELNAAKLPDDISDMIESVIDEINKGSQKIREIDEAMEKRRTELQEFERKIVDGYVKVEDEVIKVLKEKYQEEIDANKEKNEAMADADSEYLNALEAAIQKERQLRERKNQWEDLAQKEKKASLLARDTSGANRTELQDLNKEIAEDRQSLLDNTVDDILSNLKEMYDLQKEQRDRQIEIEEQSLDEQQLICEATEIISGWSSSDDVVAWMIENNKEVAEMSDAKLEQQIRDWEDYYDTVELYHNYDGSSMQAALDGDFDLINQTFIEASEAQTTEAERFVGETFNKVDQSIENAKQSLVDANKSLTEALETQKSLLNSVDNIAESVSATVVEPETGTEEMTGKSLIGKFNTSTEAASALASMKGKLSNGKNGKIQPYKDGSWGIVEADNLQKQTNSSKNGSISSMKNAHSAFYNQGMYLIGNKGDGISDKYGSHDLYNYIYKTLQPNGNWQPLMNAMKNEGIYNIGDDKPWDTAYNYLVEKWMRTNPKAMEDKGKQGYRLDNSSGIYRWEKVFKTGGLVNYTGPAWVDGTPAKPEAFLSAEDTKRIGEAAQLLSSLPLFKSFSTNEAFSQNIGDTNIEVHINVENISSDYDVDQAVDRVKQDILAAARPQGSSVILRR